MGTWSPSVHNYDNYKTLVFKYSISLLTAPTATSLLLMKCGMVEL